MKNELVNHLTNAAGTFVGAPDVVIGVSQAIAGDYLGGILTAVRGVCEFFIAYFVGK